MAWPPYGLPLDGFGCVRAYHRRRSAPNGAGGRMQKKTKALARSHAQRPTPPIGLTRAAGVYWHLGGQRLLPCGLWGTPRQAPAWTRRV